MAITEGSTSSKLCILTDFPRVSARANGVPLYGWDKTVIDECLLAAGIHPSEVLFESVLQTTPPDRQLYRVPAEKREEAIRICRERLNSFPGLNVIVPLGELPLLAVCGKKSIDKWHLSVLPTHADLACKKAVPTFGPGRWTAQYHLQVYIKMALLKARKELPSVEYKPKEIIYHLNPPLEETISILEDQVTKAEINSVDIETGRGQINTIGFAWSENEGIAINVLPDRFSPKSYYKLWEVIEKILSSPQRKVLQNAIYEYQYFSIYGIRMENVWHDTMWAQKFLWPELKMGLDEVGRFYTTQPYWKDDGKSWNSIRDWRLHYEYNVKDTVGTYEGMLWQRRDLEDRVLLDLFDNYIMKLFEPIAEMCCSGLPFNEQTLLRLRGEIDGKIKELTEELRRAPGAEKLNTQSPKQKLEFLAGKGYQIPKKYDAKTKKWKESTDEKSLKKLRLKHPEDEDLTRLIKLTHLNKASSSYLNFQYDPDCRMRFSLKGVGTETGRFASGTDVRGNGMNAQTVPGGNKGINIKQIFEAGEGKVFLQCDLRQAESRFVAYDCADFTLIEMLEDPKKDIHKYVAAEIYQKPESEITKDERQLGKKSGHGANYGMKEQTFVDSALHEMDVVLTKKEANNILESYHRLFPGIRRGHREIQQEIRRTRLLKNPLGRERQFFGRMDDNLFREAYPFRPQSTIPDITNHLMLYLCERRRAGDFDFRLLLQVHDSVLLEISEEDFDKAAAVCLDTSLWHPEINLKAGRLIIPTEVERGKSWGQMKVWN